ncbi:MAG: ABC transporter ATP-binding protein [Lachnospiraceae bacterium]|nr:ABC transporter ATP-binding protein [Lachnospiraceae bacterium]
MSVIRVNNLTKKYNDFTAVNHISFEVERGTMLGFLGVNGAGKTTVINMLATLLTPNEGSAEICGKTLGKNNQEIRRKIGIVYQQNCLDDILTVKENLICRGILHGASRAEAKAQCGKLSEILKLDEILKKRYRTLSGGQKRRAEIAAALMHTPELLFLDEPTTGLDPATRQDVWNTIKELQKNEKMTVFLTTHYMEEAAGADKIIIMDHGNIITQGTPFELKEKYASDRLRLYYRSGQEEEIQVPSTLKALPLIHAAEDKINGFEVIQGNMDDVFLNAVGRALTEEGGK